MADGEIEYDIPVHTKYKDWNEARAALVAILPPKKQHPKYTKMAVQVVRLIGRKTDDLRRRPDPAQISQWHDEENLNLFDIRRKIEERAAEIEVWNWASVVILQNLGSPDSVNSRRVPIAKHTRALSLVDKCLIDLRILFEEAAARNLT